MLILDCGNQLLPLASLPPNSTRIVSSRGYLRIAQQEIAPNKPGVMDVSMIGAIAALVSPARCWRSAGQKKRSLRICLPTAQRLLIISDGLGLPSEAAQANNTPVIALQQSNALIAKLCGRVYQ